MPREVKISRTLLPTPTLDDPNRKVFQIQYTAGELPPHFIYIPEKEWTKDKEAKLIKADIEKRLEKTGESITL